MMLKPYLASSIAIAYPIPSDPPVTKAHPPPYLSFKFFLLLKYEPTMVQTKLMILTAPIKKQKNRKASKEKNPQLLDASKFYIVDCSLMKDIISFLKN